MLRYQPSVAQRFFTGPVVGLMLLCCCGMLHAHAADAPQLIDNKIVLTAEQSTGGKLMTSAKGELIGVTIDKSCEANYKKIYGLSDAFVEWKLAAPLPPGWWHGLGESNFRLSDPRSYINKGISISLVGGQKPSVGANIVTKGPFNGPQSFEFWIYTSKPTESVRLRPTGDLWLYHNTWPVSRLTLTLAPKPPILTSTDVIALDVLVQPDGSVQLPAVLPMGKWSVGGSIKKEGTASVEEEDGKTIRLTYTLDRYKHGGMRSSRFFLNKPLTKVTVQTKDLFTSVLMNHSATRLQESPLSPDHGPLIVTVDPAKPESAYLELIGDNLTGEAPTFPLMPFGKRIAVLTSWDDGQLTDLRCAKILNRYGYHPSFFMNSNSQMMPSLDKLEALNVEVGSHCYTHTTLHLDTPQRALDECVAMRAVLEKALRHPVISFGYPNGYSPAYDVDGDYVLRAVRAAYWSGRTTWPGLETVDNISQPLTLKTDGFFGQPKDLERTWTAKRTKEGSVFYFWGHSWQIGQTEVQWKQFEDLVAKFARQPDAWYASQGEFSLWLWARKNVQITVTYKTLAKVTVKLTRPWLHPYLAARCPLSFKMPAGVQKVVWQGAEIPVSNGVVELSWRNH
jgi:peptidoglycan/xylan/chitin deacetylase (PgdA/CDA1 family)